MNLNELQNKLLEMNIPDHAYSLNGGLPNETFCIDKNTDGWKTYYSERGNKKECRVFDSEESACNYFLIWIKRNFRIS
ncbi:hypothetical protein D3P09_16625 [Paenibacillus pinisoli]|uniref:Uncharacterized protein n=1 Tax=Paenibacillus pinisoli TaxID=1276110 RepID=A0A3A6PE57_9BACL|nr:hypothetical protein [Paenibacillus pinisoli]RJX39117.1 hypothetical protein D3P09_16625 [Paenibacillus pinisoli]